jgi:hypothetical protein
MAKKFLSILLVLVLVLGLLPAAGAAALSTSPTFSDMPDNWATEALESAVANGLLVGDDGKIMPDSPLTRAQMATIIARAFGATEEGDISEYTDVKSTDWFGGSMAKALKMGVMHGYDGRMNPKDNITREQAFAVLARAFKLAPATAINKTFEDLGDVSDWAKGEVYALVNAGYIQGSNGRINPQANISRAEFAQMIHNLIKQYIKAEGEYTEVADGNIMVNVPDATLKNVTINGDLIIGDGVGNGDVTLDNVIVTGRMIVRGGGVNSIIIRGNSSVGEVVVSKVDGNVRIAVEGGANVEIVYINDGKDDVIVEGSVDKLVIDAPSVPVTIKGGTVGEVSVNSNNATVMIDKTATVTSMTASGSEPTLTVQGTVKTLTATAGATGATIEVAKGGAVDTVNAGAPSTAISGEGSVKNANVTGNNVSVDTKGTEVKVSEGVTGTTAGGNDVKPGETANTGTGTTGGSPGGGGGGGSSVAVSAISVVTPPSNIIYTEGDLLDLAGLVVKVEKSNGTEENVAFDNFASKGITTSPANGAVLATSNTKVTITVGGKSVDQTITVNAAPLTIAGYYLDTSDTALVTTANVANGTDQTTALSGLSTAGYAKLSDGTYEAITITWSFVETYDGTVAGAKAVTGIVSPAKVSEIATINQTGTVTVAEKEKVEKPVITPSKTSAANREAGVTFTIGEVSGVTFYYTVNGETPTASSTKYEGSVTLTAPEQDAEATVTIKAIGVKDGAIDSDVAVATVTYWAKDALVPKATISDVTISGMAGEIIEKEVTVTLENDGFEKMYGEWAFGGWLANTTNIVYGTVSGVKTKDIEAGDTEITVTFRFTPQGAINEAIKITIPAHCLQSNKELVAEINNDAKFAIAASNKAELFWPDDSYSGYETIVSINKSDHTLVAIPVTVEAFLVDLKGDNWWSRKMPNLLQTHVVQDSSGTEKGVSATLETGDKLLVTAQDGTGPVTYTITVSEVITAVSVTVTPPAAGQTPNYTVTLPSGAEYKVLVGETSWGDHVPSWWEIPDDDDSERVLLGDDEKFISGKKYLIVIYLVSNEGFYFDKNATVKINDEDPADWYVDVNKYMWIEYLFTATS